MRTRFILNQWQSLVEAACSNPGRTNSCTVCFLPLIIWLWLWRVMQQQLSIFSNHSPSLEQQSTLHYHNLISEPGGDLNAVFLWLSLIYKNRNVQYKDEIFSFHCSLFYFPQHIPQTFHLQRVLYLLVLCYIFAFSHLSCSYFSPYLYSFSRFQYLIKTKLKLLTSLFSVVSQGLWRIQQCNHIPINS